MECNLLCQMETLKFLRYITPSFVCIVLGSAFIPHSGDWQLAFDHGINSKLVIAEYDAALNNIHLSITINS